MLHIYYPCRIVFTLYIDEERRGGGREGWRQGGGGEEGVGVIVQGKGEILEGNRFGYRIGEGGGGERGRAINYKNEGAGRE